MTDKEKIISMIREKRETPFVDFKRDFYVELNTSDLPKDIAAFANLTEDEDKYIVFGIDDKTREVRGVERKCIIDTDKIDAYIHYTIEPFVNIEQGSFEYHGKLIAYIKVLASNDNYPYVIKANCGQDGKSEKGDIYIRKGTCNQKASRIDIDEMYRCRFIRYKNYKD